MKLVEIQEGTGSFLVPDSSINKYIPRRSDEVFFNRQQEINRDFSVLALRAYSKITEKTDLIACEPFAGTGVRSCRYLLETPISMLFCNDLNSQAIKIAKKNLDRLPALNKEDFKIYNMECNYFFQFLHVENNTFDFIDIDPYGTPIPFIRNSVQLTNLHGLLAFTATDLASLVGLYPRALYARYGISRFDIRFGNIHEIAARILITGIQHAGLTQSQSLIPILTIYHRHFIRCFLQRKRGVKNVINQTGFISLCKKCRTRYTEALGKKNTSCPVCNHKTRFEIGPIFLGKIQKLDYLSEMLQDDHLHEMGTRKLLKKILPRMIEEATLEIPWSFDIPKLSKKAGVTVPPIEKVMTHLHEMGYQSNRIHFSGNTIKTDANEDDLISIIKSLKS
ncbi:MAG: hypothetical protein ACXAC8_03635 [Candidatus Hodarchaeales archaeon]